ncbi:cobalamin B12-binding domain-containing protein [Ruminiclostridium herbifermentans]|uniref:Cobalamin B12-binding domain-containing protein n=1 Tax=Ruminiclostridium herbifermentans TaxID=2488810 RepID=A0A4U7JM20_9FIRM|nr:cobalamin-dependent protein [Ruminiclostridium herbifermentans]QNU66242.1 cobalamin B12-binding domain-containing protein [Ruminiclostridium herbifermentans]
MQKNYFNLGVSQLAGYLRRQGIQTDLLFFDSDQSDDYIFSHAFHEYTHYGFSINQENLIQAMRIAERIKYHDKAAKIIFGGPFASIYFEEIAENCSFVDYIILGDGEIPMEYLLSGKPLSGYPYIYTPGNTSASHKLYRNNKIDWEFAEDYYYSKNGDGNIHCMLTKNNICTGHCTFCTERRSSHIEYREIDKIVSEIVRLNDLYNTSYFFFVDDDLFDPGDQFAKQRIYELCEKIIELKRNLHFYCYAKATTFKDTESDNALLDIMYKAGFDTVFLGVEAANEQDLTLYNKTNCVNDNYLSMKLLNDHFIYPTIGFICFNPFSTLNTIKENFQFLIKSKVHELRHYIKAFLEIYKGSSLYNLAKKQNALGEDYNYLNLDKYKYISEDSERLTSIVNFLNEKFTSNEMFNTFDDGWAQFSVYYYGVLRYNKSLIGFREEYDILEQQYFDIIYWYFGKLYIDNDIEFCRNNYDLFIKNLNENIKKMHRLKSRIAKKDIKDRISNANV